MFYAHTCVIFYCFNLHTGIFAGMWPCGIVTLISELFLAESKAQVYGHLHQFLQSVPTTASNLSKLVFVLQKQQMTAISSR